MILSDKDENILITSQDEDFMRLALQQAEEALNIGEVPVGCVFVRKQDAQSHGTVMSMGFNETNITRNGTRHAEIVAIDKLLLTEGHFQGLFRELDLYVTCEPCIMCAAALSKLGIRRVYFGCFNDRFGGNGSVLRLHEETADFPYEVVSGLLMDEGVEMFRRFYSGENQRAPEEKRKRRRDKSALDPEESVLAPSDESHSRNCSSGCNC